MTSQADHSPQLRLFDSGGTPTGLSAKDRALRRVEEHAEASWKVMALECVRCVCERLPDFTSDDVAAELAKYPREWTSTTRALGPVMRQAAKAGYCRMTDRLRNSTRNELHYQRLQVWLSLLNRGN